jgi:hypothetical protein
MLAPEADPSGKIARIVFGSRRIILRSVRIIMFMPGVSAAITCFAIMRKIFNAHDSPFTLGGIGINAPPAEKPYKARAVKTILALIARSITVKFSIPRNLFATQCIGAIYSQVLDLEHLSHASLIQAEIARHRARFTDPFDDPLTAPVLAQMLDAQI